MSYVPVHVIDFEIQIEYTVCGHIVLNYNDFIKENVSLIT